MFPRLTERNVAALAELLALERGVTFRLEELANQARSSPPAAELLRELAGLARHHEEAVCRRFAAAGLSADVGDDARPSSSSTDSAFAVLHPAAAALRDAYALLQQGVVSWATVFPLFAHVRDSWVVTDEGTSAHLVRRCVQDYVAASGRVIAMLPDVVVDELNAAGLECHCTCPGCSIGLCVDAVSIRGILAEAMAAARPPVAEHGVALSLPRRGSTVARSAMRAGDVVVGLNGQRVETLGQLQRGISSHEAGALLEFTVRRSHGEVTIPIACLREGEDRNEDECFVPAGQPFYSDMAREARRRLREQRNCDPAGAVGLAGLSAREVQVLQLAALGATNRVIAEELEISRTTVATHIKHILNKLGAANRTDAVRVAIAGGLGPSEPS